MFSANNSISSCHHKFLPTVTESTPLQSAVFASCVNNTKRKLSRKTIEFLQSLNTTSPPPYPNSLYPVCPNDSRLFGVLYENAKAVLKSRDIKLESLLWLIVLYLLLIVVGTIGNGLMCYTVARHRHMRTPFNIMIANLAVSDMLLCVVTQPFNIVKFSQFQWKFDNLSCKISTAVPAVTVYVTTETVCAIAIYRLAMVIYPKEMRSAQKTIIIVITLVGIWTLAAMLASPLFFFGQKVLVEFCPGIVLFTACVELTTMRNGKIALSIGSLLFQYFTPTVLLVVTHFKICRVMACRLNLLRLRSGRGNNDNNTTFNETSHKTRSIRKKIARQRKTSILLGVIAVTFTVSWLPLNIFNFIADVDEYFIINRIDQSKLLFPICHLIILSSSVINPILYGWFNRNFRHEFMKMFCVNCRRSASQALHLNNARDLPLEEMQRNKPKPTECLMARQPLRLHRSSKPYQSLVAADVNTTAIVRIE